MGGYNTVKKEILALLYDVDQLTSSQAAEILGKNHESVSMTLLRYQTQGLVS